MICHTWHGSQPWHPIQTRVAAITAAHAATKPRLGNERIAALSFTTGAAVGATVETSMLSTVTVEKSMSPEYDTAVAASSMAVENDPSLIAVSRTSVTAVMTSAVVSSVSTVISKVPIAPVTASSLRRDLMSTQLLPSTVELESSPPTKDRIASSKIPISVAVTATQPMPEMVTSTSTEIISSGVSV